MMGGVRWWGQLRGGGFGEGQLGDGKAYGIVYDPFDGYQYP